MEYFACTNPVHSLALPATPWGWLHNKHLWFHPVIAKQQLSQFPIVSSMNMVMIIGLWCNTIMVHH
jgi:hypothetical protein